MERKQDSMGSESVNRVAPIVMRVVLLASLLGAGAAQAAAPHEKAVLSAYADSAGGETLLAGRYGEVIAQFGAHGVEFASDEVAASTNLCVAYIMTRQLKAAQGACTEAVEVAKLDAQGFTLFEHKTHDEEVALAYSNRAVLEWLSDSRRAAANDLSRARAFAPASEFVTQNLSALSARNAPAPALTVAQG